MATAQATSDTFPNTFYSIKDALEDTAVCFLHRTDFLVDYVESHIF